MRHADAVSMSADHVHLKQVFDPIEAFQNELVTGIELDARFSVDAFGAELGAELAFRFCAIASRLSRATYFALQNRSAPGRHTTETCLTYSNGCSPPGVVHARVRISPFQRINAALVAWYLLHPVGIRPVF